MFNLYSSKRVTFILITKNRPEQLANALANCVGFRRPEDEIIVVNGGTVDGVKDVVGRYGNLVDVFISEPDENAEHAHNKAILLAKGKYIQLLADDDRLYDAVDKSVEVMENNPEIDLLLRGVVKNRKGFVTYAYLPPSIKYGQKPEDVFVYKVSSGGAHFIRRSSLAKFGFLIPSGPGHINTDNEFVLKIIKAGGMVKFCRIKAYYHPIKDDSVIKRWSVQHRKHTQELIKEYCSRWFYTKYVLRDRFATLTQFFRNKSKSKNSHVSPEPLWDAGLSL